MLETVIDGKWYTMAVHNCSIVLIPTTYIGFNSLMVLLPCEHRTGQDRQEI